MKSQISYKRLVSNLRKIDALPPFLARVMLATAFISSGRRKFKDRQGTAEEFKELGVPAARIMAPFVGANELISGSLLGLGLLTRGATIPLFAIMAVAIATARRKDIHSYVDLTGVYEFSYILLLAYLAIEGGGKASLDHWLQRAEFKKISYGKIRRLLVERAMHLRAA